MIKYNSSVPYLLLLFFLVFGIPVINYHLDSSEIVAVKIESISPEIQQRATLPSTIKSTNDYQKLILVSTVAIGE